jgi:hypothetical protein
VSDDRLDGCRNLLYLRNAMAYRSDYRRIMKPAPAAGFASHVVEQPFMRPTLAVNPPGA